jgi:hypothetical protein
MKIRQLGTGILTIQKTALEFWFVLLFGNSISIFVLLLTAGESRLICQRSTPNNGTCELTRVSWYVQQQQNLQLSELSMAKVTKSAHLDSETGDRDYVYQVVLQLKDRQIPFSFSGFGGSGVEDELDGVAAQINEFIDRNRESRLDVRKGVPLNWLTPLGVWFLMTLIFATLISSESFSTCVFDRDSLTMTISRRRWLRLQNVEQYPFDDIVAVELEIVETDDSKAHRVNIKLRSGALVPLTQDSYTYDYHQTIESIEQFLNLSHNPSNV